MKIAFSYSLQEDAANILRGLKSINNPNPSQVEALYLAHAEGHINKRTTMLFIQEYIRSHSIDMRLEIARISDSWTHIHEPFLRRTKALFKCNYPPKTICARLTIDTRCTYSIDKNYFYVSVNSKHPSLLVMHELFHFYTWHALNKYSPAILLHLRYNDLKESLTELLNIVFGDLMNGGSDSGYAQHHQLRVLIRHLWYKHQDFYHVINDPQLMKMLNDEI